MTFLLLFAKCYVTIQVLFGFAFAGSSTKSTTWREWLGFLKDTFGMAVITAAVLAFVGAVWSL